MTRLASVLSIVVAVVATSAYGAGAQTIIGDLNNFDTVNDTGQICYGFEIEIDGIHSTDITYTFDWNHYGVPKIREDNTDPAHPKVFVRYESTKDSNGQWGANGSFTNQALPTLTPPQGHTCTDTSVNEGCEHFGVGYYGTPATVKYHWLIDDNAGGLVYFGTPVGVAKPTWNYTAPAPGVAAQVVAVIPAPAAPVAGKEFGEPFFVKVIKTTTHNANPIVLSDLISDDANNDGKADWQNGEPDEVETEWKLLQASTGGGGANDELQGAADDMGSDGSEVVTRRYEFYRYGADPNTIDGETGEAMCSDVQPTNDPNDPLYRHGVGTDVTVTGADGNPYSVNCEAQVVVGNYIGAQMAGFAAAAPLGLIDHLQDGTSGTPYTPRTVVVGGAAPFTIAFPFGSLPQGLSLGPNGVLSGTPTESGDFTFTVQATDDVGASASQGYTLHIAGAPVPQADLTVQKSGTGAGTVSGNGIDCGATCIKALDVGTPVALTATPDAGSRFVGWSGACTGTGSCSFTLSTSATVTAEFAKQWQLSASTSGTGTGTVSGSGIDCGATCSVLLDQGTPVLLDASPATGSVFTGWSGDCTGTGSCSPTMDAARSVTATFVPATQLYTLSVTVTGSGSVTSSPRGVNCGKHCTDSLAVGTSVTLTAKPKGQKHNFLGWTGACEPSGTSTSCTIEMLGDANVGANFD